MMRNQLETLPRINSKMHRKAYRRRSTQNISRKESRRSSQQESSHTSRYEDGVDMTEWSLISPLADGRSKDDDRRKMHRRRSSTQHTSKSESLRSIQEKRHTSRYDDSTDIPSSHISSLLDGRSKDDDRRKMHRRSSTQNTSRSESLRPSQESSHSSRYDDSTDIPSSRISSLVDGRSKDDDRRKMHRRSSTQSISTKTGSGNSTSRYDDAMEIPLSSVKYDRYRQRGNIRNSTQHASNRMGNGKSSQEINANYSIRYDNGTGGRRSSIQSTSKKSEIVRTEKEITHSSDKQPFDMTMPLPRRRRHQLVSTASKHNANSDVSQQMRTLKLINVLHKKILSMEKEINQYKVTEILLRNELKRNEKMKKSYKECQ